MVENWEIESVGDKPIPPRPDPTKTLVSSQVFTEPTHTNGDGKTVWKVRGVYIYQDE